MDKEISDYFYERNKQLFNSLARGMTKKEAANLFCLAENTIRTMWKEHRHKYPQHYVSRGTTPLGGN